MIRNGDKVWQHYNIIKNIVDVDGKEINFTFSPNMFTNMYEPSQLSSQETDSEEQSTTSFDWQSLRISLGVGLLITGLVILIQRVNRPRPAQPGETLDSEKMSDDKGI